MAYSYDFDLAGQTYRLWIANRHFYVLEASGVLPIRTWPAWCEHCQKFTAAELMLPITEEAKELSEIEYFAERPGLIPPDRYVPIRQLPELRLWKTWRETRRSPAKCLSCGSMDITSIWPVPDVEIPGRGKCVGRFTGWAEVSGGPPDGYYSPEGDPVRFTLARRRSGRAT